MRYHHIVFDVDGTLLDTEEAILQSFQKTLREHAGIEKDLSELSFCLGITGAAALKRLETGHEEEILLQWKENLAALRDFVRVFDGIELLLKRLRADGFQLGVVTSRCRAEYERDFMRLGLDGYFDTVVCEEDTVCHKPEAEPLECYMRSETGGGALHRGQHLRHGMRQGGEDRLWSGSVGSRQREAYPRGLLLPGSGLRAVGSGAAGRRG